MATNSKQRLKFSKFLKSKWITNAKDFELKKPTIVVNISNTDAIISGPAPRKVLQPRKSTILQGVCIISAQSLILIKLPDETNIGGMVLDDGWCQLTALDPTYPKDVPLYKSPQFNVGTVELDPYAVTGSEKPSLGTVEFDPYAVTGSEKPSLGTVEFDPYAVTGSEKPSLGTVELDPYAVTGSDKPSQGGGVKKFNIKVNVWFSPGKTHCGLHNHHTDPEMLEVHTQIYGTGRMQKFHDNDFKSMYEDVIMAPGFTHDPFTGVKENGDLFYGWHQYYCDTNCIWMAIEHHPA